MTLIRCPFHQLISTFLMSNLSKSFKGPYLLLRSNMKIKNKLTQVQATRIFSRNTKRIKLFSNKNTQNLLRKLEKLLLKTRWWSIAAKMCRLSMVGPSTYPLPCPKYTELTNKLSKYPKLVPLDWKKKESEFKPWLKGSMMLFAFDFKRAYKILFRIDGKRHIKHEGICK